MARPCTRCYSTERLNGRWCVENEIIRAREWHVACGDDVKLNEPVQTDCTRLNLPTVQFIARQIRRYDRRICRIE